MTSSYKSFAVVGAGGIGQFIIKSLLSHNGSTIILSRKSSKSTMTMSRVSRPSSKTCRRCSHFHLGSLRWSPVAISIAQAAKAAGVKLFVLSEFGDVTEGHLKAIGLPTARFYTGCFSSYVPWFTDLNVNGKINILKRHSGTQPITWTAEEDIGGFVAHVLMTLPAKDIEFKGFRVQGQSASLVEMAGLLRKEIARVDELPGEHIPMKIILLDVFDTGFGSTGWDPAIQGEGDGLADSTNKLWPGHEWVTLQQLYKTESKST
ncbi:hypothetical protein C8J56DRAFT_770131 [Mycena floridula]|nr:hypothetical protein C8J56DRAFT_770131 [Mycena floridula]